jgi:hypothetical protein
MSKNQYKGYIDDTNLQGMACNERDKQQIGSSERQTCNQIIHANDEGRGINSRNPYSGPEDMTGQARIDFQRIVSKK